MFLTFIYMKNGKTKKGGMVLKSRLLLRGTGQPTEYVVLKLSLWRMFSQVSPNSCSESNLTKWVTFYTSENWYFLSVYSPKYCIICVKWLSSRPMLNSFSNSYQILQSTLSLSLSNSLSFSPLLYEVICLSKATKHINYLWVHKPCSELLRFHFGFEFIVGKMW